MPGGKGECGLRQPNAVPLAHRRELTCTDRLGLHHLGSEDAGHDRRDSVLQATIEQRLRGLVEQRVLPGEQDRVHLDVAHDPIQHLHIP